MVITVRGRSLPAARDRRARSAACQSCAVDDVGPVARHEAGADQGRGAAERGKARPVVGMVVARRPDIGAARPVVEMRRVEDEHREPRDVGGEDARRPAEEIVDRGDRLGALDLGEHDG